MSLSSRQKEKKKKKNKVTRIEWARGGGKESVSQAEKVRSERHGAREWVCHWTALSGQWRKLCKSANPIVSSYDWEECGARGSWQSSWHKQLCVRAHVCVHVCARSVPVNTSLVNVQVRKCVHEVYCLVIIRNVAYATVRKAIKKWWTSELNHSRVYYFFLMQMLSGFFLLFSSLIFF